MIENSDIPYSDKFQIKTRTDWGNLLDSVSHPEEPQVPKTGKGVDLFIKPVW